MDEKLKAFWVKLNTGLGELWEKNKIFLLLLLPLILIVQFRSVWIKWLVSSGRRLLENTKKTDEQLAQQQNAANNAANALRDEANKLGENKPPVDEDWYKK